jgi:hypothetical protein
MIGLAKKPIPSEVRLSLTVALMDAPVTIIEDDFPMGRVDERKIP